MLLDLDQFKFPAAITWGSNARSPLRRLLCLQPLDRIEDPVPGLGAGHVALVERLVGALRGLERGVVAVALHQEHGGLPDVAVGDHCFSVPRVSREPTITRQ